MKKLFLVLFLFVVQAQAFEQGCKIPPSRLEEVGTRIVQNYSNEGKPIPDSILVSSSYVEKVESTASGQVKRSIGVLEGFYRPVDDDFYVLPIPLFGAALSRERNVIYVCAYYDSAHPEISHLTVYMMRGYHLEPTSLSTVVGDIMRKPQLRVLPLNVGFLNAGTITRKLVPFMKWLAPFQVGVRVMDGIQRILTNLLGDVFGLGVERISITPEYIELANGIDLNNPSNARVLRRIDLNQAPSSQ